MTPVESDDDQAAFADEALRVAGLAYDRVMSGTEPRVDTMPPELTPADAVRWIGDRVTELVAGFAELPLDRLIDSGAATAVDHDHESERPQGEPLTMTSRQGGLGEVRIWIHPIGDLHGTLRFRLSDLQSGTGNAAPGGTAMFVPTEIDVAPGPPASVLLRYPVPAGSTPDRYHGLVLATGDADAVVPITLVIT